MIHGRGLIIIIMSHRNNMDEKEPVSLPRGGLHHVTRGQPTNQPCTAEQAPVPKAPTGPSAPSKHADCESAEASVEATSGCSYYSTAQNNDVEPRTGKTANVTQNAAAKEPCGPTKSSASVATHEGAATTTTGHPVTAEPSKAASVQPGTSQSPQDPSSSTSSPKTKTTAQRRLSEELADLARDPPPGCSAQLANRGYPFKWRAVVGGPKDTPFEGGTFGMDITFPQDYPNSPPKIKFTTKIYHPNVSEDGDIGLDILRSKWSPAVTVEFVLVAIVDLMKTPDMNCVLHQKAAQHYKDDYQLYDTIAREWTQTYARPDVEDPGVWPPVI